MTRPNPALSLVALALATAFVQPLARADDSGAPLIPYGVLPDTAPDTVFFVFERTVSLIVAELGREQDVPRRTRLVADLGKCDQPASIAALARLLNDPAPLVRAAAVRSLAQLKSAAPQWPAIEAKMADESPDVRLEVVRAAQQFGTGSAALVKAVADTDDAVRGAAVSVSVDDATDQAIAGKLADLPPVTQASAARALGHRKSSAAVPALVKLLDSSSVLVRCAALDALAEIGAVDRALVEAQLAHAHPAVRTAAARAAAKLPDAADRLAIGLRVLGDKDLAVRVRAAGLLGTLGNGEVIGPLVAQLGQGYEPLHQSARSALLTLAKTTPDQKPAVIAAAVPLLTHADAGRREDASLLLGELRSGEAFESHVKLLEDPDWLVVNQAAKSMGLIGNPAAGEALIATMRRAIGEGDTGFAAWYEAAPFLQRIARSSAGESAVLSATALKYEPILAATKAMYLSKTAAPQTRGAAVWALGALTSGDSGAATMRSLMGRLTDIEESPSVVLEGIKAAGNARAKSLKGALEKIARDQPNDIGRAAHDALDRIDGTTTPYVLPASREPIDTSVQDLTPAAN